jgi:hypothetical protein
MKQMAVAGFMATPSPMPRFNISICSHHPRRVAAPARMTRALAPRVSGRRI